MCDPSADAIRAASRRLPVCDGAPCFPGSYKANVLPLGSKTKAECGTAAAASESEPWLGRRRRAAPPLRCGAVLPGR
jgi:hypothetical protein